MSTQTTTTDAASGAEGDLAARFEAKREESELKGRATGMRAHRAYWLGRTSAFADARDMARADVAAPVTGTEGDHRELRAVMRQLSAAKNAGGVEDAEAQAQVLGHAVDAYIGQIREFLATAPPPAGAERVDLEKQIDAAAEAILSRRGFGYYTDPMEGGQDAYDISIEAREEAAAALRAASPLVPASLPAALGRGEGTAGATPAGSGSRPSDQAASHPARDRELGSLRQERDRLKQDVERLTVNLAAERAACGVLAGEIEALRRTTRPVSVERSLSDTNQVEVSGTGTTVDGEYVAKARYDHLKGEVDRLSAVCSGASTAAKRKIRKHLARALGATYEGKPPSLRDLLDRTTELNARMRGLEK